MGAWNHIPLVSFLSVFIGLEIDGTRKLILHLVICCQIDLKEHLSVILEETLLWGWMELPLFSTACFYYLLVGSLATSL